MIFFVRAMRAGAGGSCAGRDGPLAALAERTGALAVVSAASALSTSNTSRCA
jgi:hypothetical protein